jgi:hypothetical protein
MPAINGAVVGAGAPPPAVNPAHLHARYIVPKIQFIFSQIRNCAASVLIATFMCCERFIYFQDQSTCFGCSKIDRPILEIYKSLTDTVYECKNGTEDAQFLFWKYIKKRNKNRNGRQNIIILFWKKEAEPVHSFISGNT